MYGETEKKSEQIKGMENRTKNKNTHKKMFQMKKKRKK